MYVIVYQMVYDRHITLIMIGIHLASKSPQIWAVDIHLARSQQNDKMLPLQVWDRAW